MDRTSWIGAISCGALLIAWYFYADTVYPKKPHTTPPVPLSTSTTPGTSSPAPSAQALPSLTAGTSNTKSPAPLPSQTPEQTIALENDSIKAIFTSHGGAIKEVELLKHVGKTKEKTIVLHEHPSISFLARTGWTENAEVYTLSKQNNQVTARATLPNGLIIERVFTLEKDYQLTLQETLQNPSAQSIILPNFNLSIGSGEPVHFHDQPSYLKSGWMARGSDSYHGKTIADMSGGFFSTAKSQVKEPCPDLNWVSSTNQFFASLVKVPAELKALEITWNKLDIPKDSPAPAPHLFGIYTTVLFPGFAITPQSKVVWNYEIYTGPKEYELLKNLPDHQSEVMDFSIWGWVIRPLLWAMHHIHHYVPSYGWVIIILTILLKLIFWPLQSTANTSMKKMQALAPKMEEIKKKHEKDPQKMNTEVMKLYRDYGVNPFGGCLPMLVQFPIFLGLYTMLQSAVEVRNESFLWIKDLAQPDTIYSMALLGQNIDINPLPLIMTATSILLMRMTPQASDNPQMKILQWMPLMFLFMLYNFAAALSLYWTVNNLLSMIQTYQNLKSPPPTLHRVKKKAPFGFGNLPSS